MTDQQLKEFLDVWKKLNNENRKAVLEYAKKLLEGQKWIVHIKAARTARKSA